MIPVHALPDELLVGFRARLALVYGVSASSALDRKLVAEYRRLTNDEVAPVVALTRLGAAAASCNEWELLMRHSNVAINSSVDRPLTLVELASPLNSTRVSQIMSPATPQFRLCTRCVEEDLSKIGFSYWRRSHHIPGRYVCESHGVPLHLVHPQLPLTSLPQNWIGSGESADEFLVQSHHFNPYVRWYLEHMDQVAAGLHHKDGRRYKGEINSALRSWRRNGSGWATQLARLIADAFTVEWLGATVSKACASIDGVSQNIVAPILYDYLSASQREMAVAAGLAYAREG